MKKTFLTILRNKNTDAATFRNSAHRLANILAVETFTFIKEKEISVTTPFTETTGFERKQNIVLIPILRAGLAFLPTFLSYFEDAKVGFLGLKRDEKTAEAKEYYKNIPEIKSDDLVILLDPMLATGGSASSAIQSIMKSGAKENQIIFVALLVAPEGLEKLNKKFPELKIIYIQKDEKLNKEKYILPGFGDFGDRYFG